MVQLLYGPNKGTAGCGQQRDMGGDDQLIKVREKGKIRFRVKNLSS